jgi:hypothetical protein
MTWRASKASSNTLTYSNYLQKWALLFRATSRDCGQILIFLLMRRRLDHIGSEDRIVGDRQQRKLLLWTVFDHPQQRRKKKRAKTSARFPFLWSDASH